MSSLSTKDALTALKKAADRLEDAANFIADEVSSKAAEQWAIAAEEARAVVIAADDEEPHEPWCDQACDCGARYRR